ncbi:MAG: hypothetical protein JRM76_00600 [Nitrososphaerota archaeon]|nr:hypothetical protein [Nitrososphaerota archaeon]MDG6984024.1 hypothetical protein [Nitrososphaerota archaeon]MDG6991736.1 hypothetical protein [Nitrososphaerota archaeon]MDG7003889.1 hypothetical protein [Nitrososphaerota archaeon]
MSSQGLRRPSIRSGGLVRRESPATLHDRSLRKTGNIRPIFTISQVPHRKQRYETVGDWIPGKPAQIRVSRMRDQRYVFLVALHEMIEYELCKMHGISDKEVVAFDVNFEAERKMNLHPIDAEPGDHPKAPYRNEHAFATTIEMMVAQKLGVRWSDYEKTVLSLGPKPKKVLVRPRLRSRR